MFPEDLLLAGKPSFYSSELLLDDNDIITFIIEYDNAAPIEHFQIVEFKTRLLYTALYPNIDNEEAFDRIIEYLTQTYINRLTTNLNYHLYKPLSNIIVKYIKYDLKYIKVY